MTTLMTRRQQESKTSKVKVGGLKKHRFEPYRHSSRTCTGSKKKQLPFRKPSVAKSVEFASPTSSDPEWDRAEQGIINDDTVLSPEVKVDTFTTTAPGPGALVRLFSSGAEYNRVDLDHVLDSDVPSPTPLIIVTGSPSQDSDGSECCMVSEMDLLDQYQVQSIMGEGSFGTVAKATNMFTGDTVAIKILKNRSDYDEVAAHEMAVLRALRVLDPDSCGIVRFYHSFVYEGFTCMVFESLEMNLLDFLVARQCPLSMMEMRYIIHQLAITLQALSGIGLIHTDIKLDNIMLVNQQEQPLKVKLIDFGLAVPVSETNQRTVRQPLWFTSPELFLGLPITGALDMWSLGCMVANGVLATYLFRGKTEYDVFRSILFTLGMPEQSLLDAGQKTSSFFIQLDNTWTFKEPEEYYPMPEFKAEDKDFFLDDACSLEEMFSSLRYNADETSYDAFMDLLKRMLHLDPEERITPDQVLDHPFITMSHL